MKEAKETVGTAKPLVDFGKAIKALKEGKRVQRLGWNGKDLFIFMQIPSEVPEKIIPKMTSLPQSVKDEFKRRADSSAYDDRPRYQVSENFRSIRYKNQIAMVYPDNTIYGWVASPSDVLEEDWIIID